METRHIAECEEEILRLKEFLKISQEECKAHEENSQILMHDLRGSLAIAGGLSRPKIWDRLTPEKRSRRISAIHNSIVVAENTMNIMKVLYGSKGELQRNAETIILPDLAKTYIRSIEDSLLREDVGFHLKSTGDGSYPLSVYADRAVMGLILGNIIGNGINNAEKYSKIKLGMREEKGLLKIVGETKYKQGEKRDVSGKSSGLGIYNIKKVAHVLEGNVVIYESSGIDTTYIECIKFGYLGESESTLKIKTHRIEVSIPTANLKKQRANKKQ